MRKATVYYFDKKVGEIVESAEGDFTFAYDGGFSVLVRRQGLRIRRKN